MINPNPYSLHSQDKKVSLDSGPPEVIPCRSGTSREGQPASSIETQDEFFQMVGLLDSSNDLLATPTLTEEEAKIFASALNHSYYEECEGEDKYFTPEEFRRQFSKYALGSKYTIENNVTVSTAEEESLVQEYEGFSKQCQCHAHKAFREANDLFYSDCIGRLVSLPNQLTDHYGIELAESLLPFLFNKANVKGVNRCISRCGLGSPYSVNFVLKMPSGKVYQFNGCPKLTVNSPFFGIISRFTLVGIGEVQSPPWRRKDETESAALSQAGIYAVGQFAKGMSEPLPAIVIHKEKTIQIAIARLNGGEANDTNSVGTVTFKLVGRVDPFDLKDPKDLRIFSGLVKGITSVISAPTAN
jgi:hypothetical protein